MKRRDALIAALSLAAAGRGRAASPALCAAVLDVRPWGWSDSGQLCGVFADWFARFESQLGMPLDLVLRPLARARQELRRGELDLVLMLEQPQVGVALGEVARLELVMIGADRGRLGVLRGAALPPLAPHWRCVELSTARQQVQMLALGRLDAVLGVRQNFSAALASWPLPAALQATLRPLTALPLTLWLSPRWAGAALEERSRQALVAMRGRQALGQLAAASDGERCRAPQAQPSASLMTPPPRQTSPS